MNPNLAYTVTCGRASIAGTYGDDLFDIVYFIQNLIVAIETGELPEEEDDADIISGTLEHIGLERENGEPGVNDGEPVWLGIRSQSDMFDVAIWEGCYLRNPHYEDVASI